MKVTASRKVRPSRRGPRPPEAPPAPRIDAELTARWRAPGENGGTRGDELRARLEGLRDAGETVLPSSLMDLRGAPLVRLDLSGMGLMRADLSGADLSESDLTDAMMLGARCENTIFFRARLEGAELANADLTGANLTAAYCERTGFGRACLDGANLSEVDAGNASFTGAKMRGAVLGAGKFRDARLREADLSGADAFRADFRGADLEKLDASGAMFDESDLRGARLTGLRGFETASWLGADLRDVNFVGAYLFRRFAMDQNYLAEFRDQNRVQRIVYHIWRLTSDCGRSITRWGACTVALGIVFGFLYSAVDVGYGDHETWLSPFYFSVVTLTTLGYGDVLPQSVAAQVICIIEVIIGYVMLGGMLAIFSNKLARRAD